MAGQRFGPGCVRPGGRARRGGIGEEAGGEVLLSRGARAGCRCGCAARACSKGSAAPSFEQVVAGYADFVHQAGGLFDLRRRRRSRGGRRSCPWACGGIHALVVRGAAVEAGHVGGDFGKG